MLSRIRRADAAGYHAAAQATATAILFVLLVLATSAGATGQVGEWAADFTLQDTDNNIVRLQNSLGEVRLLFMVGWG